VSVCAADQPVPVTAEMVIGFAVIGGCCLVQRLLFGKVEGASGEVDIMGPWRP